MPFLFPEDRHEADPADLENLPIEEEPEARTSANPEGRRLETTLLRLIGAQSQALAEAAHTERLPMLKDGRAFPGGGQNMTGVAGYLLENGFTNLKQSALQKHLSAALKVYDRPQPKPAGTAVDSGR
jgi:hypothetical protein